MRILLLSVLTYFILSSCSVTKQLDKSAKQNVLKSEALQAAHVGISVYEPATGKYWYNYQGDKYFVPASNTKIPTCYAAMKYLGDSLVGLRYRHNDYLNEFTLIPTGDPTFLHPNFRSDRILSFFKSNRDKKFSFNISGIWQEFPLGNGWSWNDFEASYMAERSPFPIYGNVVQFNRIGDIEINDVDFRLKVSGIQAYPTYFMKNLELMVGAAAKTNLIKLNRKIKGNDFQLRYSNDVFIRDEIPFATDSLTTFIRLLNDTVDINWSYTSTDNANDERINYLANGGRYIWPNPNVLERKILYKSIHSQPTDSLLKPMMHRSDNFFAEQSLLMVSNEMLGVMNDAKIIDSILKTDFKDLPQKPRWADGSGLSRYNLFTPKDMVAILNKMQSEFGMERIKEIFPTGGEGTLSSYYKSSQGFIFAKTGTLSGVVALSGFLYTKKNKLLIFSVLVNNHTSSATQIRRAVEKFITGIRESY